MLACRGSLRSSSSRRSITCLALASASKYANTVADRVGDRLVRGDPHPPGLVVLIAGRQRQPQLALARLVQAPAAQPGASTCNSASDIVPLSPSTAGRCATPGDRSRRSRRSACRSARTGPAADTSRRFAAPAAKPRSRPRSRPCRARRRRPAPESRRGRPCSSPSGPGPRRPRQPRRRPAERDRPVGQLILTLAALGVVLDLRHRRLTHIHVRLARRCWRSTLLTAPPLVEDARDRPGEQPQDPLLSLGRERLPHPIGPTRPLHGKGKLTRRRLKSAHGVHLHELLALLGRRAYVPLPSLPEASAPATAAADGPLRPTTTPPPLARRPPPALVAAPRPCPASHPANARSDTAPAHPPASLDHQPLAAQRVMRRGDRHLPGQRWAQLMQSVMLVVPGRKTDIKDASGCASWSEAGLMRASFVPPKPIRALRNLTRYRKTQIRNARVKPTGCTRRSRTPGSSSTASPPTSSASPVARCSTRSCGHHRPEVLADWPRASCAEDARAAEALEGRFEPLHAMVIGAILAHLDFLDEQIANAH